MKEESLHVAIIPLSVNDASSTVPFLLCFLSRENEALCFDGVDDYVELHHHLHIKANMR